MAVFHDAPIFHLSNEALLRQFCERYALSAALSRSALITGIASAFSALPYENLTKIIKSNGVVGPQSAMRYPDELIADHLRWGTGGTCFSLTAAIIALYDAFGIEAQPLLADRHYGADTHCGLVIIDNGTWLLLDPGYLLFTPVALPTTVTAVVEQGYTTIELVPQELGKRIELVTVVKGSRKVRLSYKRAIVDPETFAHAWCASFAWEMMTYPVLTRCVAGEHRYLQGGSLAVRTAEKTRRKKIDITDSIACISNDFGLAPEITAKAWEIVRGKN